MVLMGGRRVDNLDSECMVAAVRFGGLGLLDIDCWPIAIRPWRDVGHGQASRYYGTGTAALFEFSITKTIVNMEANVV